MKRGNLHAELVLVAEDRISRLNIHGDHHKELFNPDVQVFVMIGGVPHSKRGRRKRKYPRIVVDPLDCNACYKVATRKRTPHDRKAWSEWFPKISKPVGTKGKKINIKPEVYREAMKKVERQLETIIG